MEHRLEQGMGDHHKMLKRTWIKTDGAREMHRVSSSNSLISREPTPTSRNSNILQGSHQELNGAVPWIKTNLEVRNSPREEEFLRSIMIRGGPTPIIKRSKGKERLREVAWARSINRKIWTLGAGKIARHQTRLSLPTILAARHLKSSNSLVSRRRTTSKSTSRNPWDPEKESQRLTRMHGKTSESYLQRWKKKGLGERQSRRWKKMTQTLPN